VKSGGDLIVAPMSRVIAFAVLFAIGASVIPTHAIDRICTGAATNELVNVAVLSGTVGVEVRLVPVIQTMAPPTSERQATTTT
jgi:hypothetical protein